MRLVSVLPAPPLPNTHLTHTLPPPMPACTGLTIASHFSLLPASPYYLQCKQRPFYLHTRPAPGAAVAAAAAASKVRPTCAPNKGDFLCWSLARVQLHQPAICFDSIFLRFARRAGRASERVDVLLTCHVACCAPSGHDPT